MRGVMIYKTMISKALIFALVLSLVALSISVFQIYAGSTLDEFASKNTPSDTNFSKVISAIEDGRIVLTKEKSLELILNQRELLISHIGAFENSKPAFQVFGIILGAICILQLITLIYIFVKFRENKS